jgi:hypothetical protein
MTSTTLPPRWTRRRERRRRLRRPVLLALRQREHRLLPLRAKSGDLVGATVQRRRFYGNDDKFEFDGDRYVPKQVIASVNHDHNTNFDAEFCYAGDVVSCKCVVPYLYRFELMGNPEAVQAGRSCSSWPRSTGSVG